MTNKEYYRKRQNEVRDEAIWWQLEFCEHNYSWGELAWYGEYFYKLAKRYGLIKEFKENGIC